MSDASDMEARNRSPWHMDRSISITHIVTTVTISASVMIWAMKMDTRVSVLEMQAIHQTETDHRQDKDVQDRMQLVRDDLRDINHKLDRLVEGKSGAAR